MDAVQKLPGHPGAPMGMADIAEASMERFFLNITPPIRPGMTVIVLSFPTSRLHAAYSSLPF